MNAAVPPPDYERPMRHEMMNGMRKAMGTAWKQGFAFGLMVGACFGSSLTLFVLVATIKWRMTH